MSKKKMYAEGDEIALGTTHAVLDACLGKKVHFSLDLRWVDVDLEPYIYKLAHCLLNCAHCNLQRRAVAAYGIVLSASTYGYELDLGMGHPTRTTRPNPPEKNPTRATWRVGAGCIF